MVTLGPVTAFRTTDTSFEPWCMIKSVTNWISFSRIVLWLEHVWDAITISSYQDQKGLGNASNLSLDLSDKVTVLLHCAAQRVWVSAFKISLLGSQAGADGCTEQPQSIKAKLQAAQDELQIWMERRNVRQQKFETLKARALWYLQSHGLCKRSSRSSKCSLNNKCMLCIMHALSEDSVYEKKLTFSSFMQGKCEQLRHQLGLAGSSVPVKTVTLYVLDGLAMELQNLQAEQEERQKRLDLRLKVYLWLSQDSWQFSWVLCWLDRCM